MNHIYIHVVTINKVISCTYNSDCVRAITQEQISIKLKKLNNLQMSEMFVLYTLQPRHIVNKSNEIPITNNNTFNLNCNVEIFH